MLWLTFCCLQEYPLFTTALNRVLMVVMTLRTGNSLPILIGYHEQQIARVLESAIQVENN